MQITDRLTLDDTLHAFVETELLPGTGIAPEAFWAGLERILAGFTPRNAALLARRDELQARIDDWWFIQDPAVLEGELAVAPGEHEVEVGLRLYIPYIVTDHGVLMIDEHGTRTMEAVSA